MLELADCGALVAEHLPEFHAVHHLFCGIARSGGVAAPDFAFHVVLEQHTWDAETSGKVDRSIQEIADGDIEAPLAEPGLDLLLDFGMSKAADRIRRLGPEMSQIIEAARGSRKFALAGTDGHRAGQLLLQIALVVRVGRSSIVGIKRKLMPRGQISQDVVRADIAAVLHGEELIGFYPENSHTDLLMSSFLRRSANPNCLSASDKVDKGDDGGGIEDDESARGIGNARERADLDAGERGQAERVKRKLRPERRAIERLGQEHGSD